MKFIASIMQNAFYTESNINSNGETTMADVIVEKERRSSTGLILAIIIIALLVLAALFVFPRYVGGGTGTGTPAPAPTKTGTSPY